MPNLELHRSAKVDVHEEISASEELPLILVIVRQVHTIASTVLPISHFSRNAIFVIIKRYHG